MYTYRRVIENHYEYRGEGGTEAVTYTDKVEKIIGLPVGGVRQALNKITSKVKQEQNEARLERSLRASVEYSTLGFEGLKRLAKSQINPFYVYQKQPMDVTRQAHRLLVSRILYEAVTGEVASAVEPTYRTLPTDRSPSKFATQLRFLNDELFPPRTSSAESARAITAEAAEQEVRAYGLGEATIARIALSELEPDRVLDQMAENKLSAFSQECGILMSARNICRSMHRITQVE